jgi:integrase/recombinase XerD
MNGQGCAVGQIHKIINNEVENGATTGTLLTRSRHTSIRALERYARPGPQAVADPAALSRTGHGR